MSVACPSHDHDEQPRNLPAIGNEWQQTDPQNQQVHDPVNRWNELVQAMQATIDRLESRRPFYEEECTAGKAYAFTMLQMLNEVVTRLTLNIHYGADEMSVLYWIQQGRIF